MLSVAEALALVLSHARPLGSVRLPALDAVGLTLAEEITSDIDSPPHDKSMMDGYALTAEDLARPSVELTVIEAVTAGDVPTKTLTPGHATRIMTGAPIPSGAAGVVMVERTELLVTGGGQDERVRILETRLPEFGNILRRATSLARGQTVLRAGTLIRPIEVGVLAEVGRMEIAVHDRPRIAVMTSGNELVTPDRMPGPGQIRNSNNPMVVALAQRAGAEVVDLGNARDTADDIRALVTRGLAHDVLVLSGGVSAGVLDLAPSVLRDAGVVEKFHKVNLKPGKPLWFGVHRRASVSLALEARADAGQLRRLPYETLVFGLPGNPVSSLVCFELFIRPALAQLLGRSGEGLPRSTARLAEAFTHRGNRPTFFPGRSHRDDAHEFHVTPLPWLGSADLAALAQADCLIHFPAGDRAFAVGETVVVSWL